MRVKIRLENEKGNMSCENKIADKVALLIFGIGNDNLYFNQY